MSTKIWTAYALRPGFDLYDVAMDIRRRAERRVQKRLTVLYRALIEDAKAKRGDMLDAETLRKYDGRSFGYLDASRWVHQRYIEQLGKTEMNVWDLDVSITIRRASKRRYLMIPYAGSGLFGDVLHFMRRHEALVDYHYQNQTDRPRHISAREWNARARTWAPLLADDRWQDKFIVNVVSSDGWHHVCPSFALAVKESRRAARR